MVDRPPAEPPIDDIAAEVRRAITEAGVGDEVLSIDLVTMGAVGAIEVDASNGAVRLEITLPTPARGLRGAIDTSITRVVTEATAVNRVEVDWQPRVPQFPGTVDFLPDVKNVIAVGSGKGGVGKSTVATNLAMALAQTGVRVGLLDADIYGPNAPALLGDRGTAPETTDDDRMIPPTIDGVSVMSMAFLADDSDPIIWRGVLVDEMIQQLFVDVAWGPLDYLIVDLPPGTGDAQLSLVQHVPVTGAVLVTTPQDVAVEDTRRALEAFANNNVAILGVVDNMTEFVCPDCSGHHRIFDAGGADTLSEEFDIPVLGSIPIEPAIGDIVEEAPSEPPGLTLPGIGRIQLPRTSEERAGHSLRPPVVGRAAESQAATAFREIATRTAARTHYLVNGDVIDHVH